MVVWLSCRDSPCARCSLWLTRTTSKQYGVFIMVRLLTHYLYLILLIDWLIAVLHLIGNVSAIYQRLTAPLWRLLKRSSYWIVLILKFCLNCYLVKAIYRIHNRRIVHFKTEYGVVRCMDNFIEKNVLWWHTSAPTCSIIYFSMQNNYVHRRLIYVNMQHNAEMQHDLNLLLTIILHDNIIICYRLT